MNLQQNQREITPIDIWSDGSFYSANVLRLSLYTGYDFMVSAGQVHYALIEHNEDVDGSIFDNVITEGNVPLTYALVDTWGTNDQPIFDFVAQHLQLTLV
jgi:hypothetical protein